MNLTIGKKNIEASFKRIADEILLNYNLEIGFSKFEIVEIEFYFYCNEHKDVFAHKHEAVENGRLRLHGAGIDITFKSNSDEYGGILIRSIKEGNSDEYINGPWKSAEKIISSINLFNKDGCIKFKNRNSPKDNKIIQGRRIGLKKPVIINEGNEEEMKEKEYRFVTDLFEKNKVREKEILAGKLSSDEERKTFLGYHLNFK